MHPNAPQAPADPEEDSYGVRKRLVFVAEALRELGPRRVLDIGCGTGVHLTIPLARAFPDAHFTGIDSDTTSIEHARRANTLPNVTFGTSAGESGDFDLIIASEVTEHVEDPQRFLEELRGKLAPGGRLVLTVPNGYGAFEIAELVRTTLVVTRAYDALRCAAAALGLKRSVPAAAPDTMAVSPHVNFFSFGTITQLARASGFEVERYRPRTFLCGFGFDRAMRGRPGLAAWNARVTENLPPALAADWMFVLKPAQPAAARPYRRGWYARLRRGLNDKAARMSAAA